MSFIEGFSKSLGSYFTNQANESARSEREKRDYEWKIKKASELEEQAAKNRVVSTLPFEQNGQLMAQPVNAAGEPVGQPRPASQGEIARWTKEKETEARATKKDELLISKAEQDIEAGEWEAKNRGRKLEADLAESGARVGMYGAQAAGARANAEETSLRTKLLGELTPEERKRFALTGGRGMGAEGVEKTSDQRNLTKEASDVAADIDNMNLPDLIRQEALAEITRIEAMPNLSSSARIQMLKEVKANYKMYETSGTESGNMSPVLSSEEAARTYLPSGSPLQQALSNFR